ncbi:MAG: HD domain-containing protein [Alistipes sp.]|nr:HD domain-containing protein [Alistipes sp.]
MKIGSKAGYILECLENAGFKAYLVGGCVRDMIMGRDINDVDIATSALPHETARVFSCDKVVATGIKHGTVTVIHDGESFEITTLRRDGSYGDLRHPDSVIFTDDILEDLGRRDFTVNAVAMDSDGNIYDPYGGRRDIERKVIRCVGDPVKRFSEDALRIMRAVRFSSVLGFDIEKETADAALALCGNLAEISAERKRVELVKLISGKSCVPVMLKYREIIAAVIPEMRDCFDFCQHSRYHKYDVYEHIVRSVDAVDADDPDSLLLRTAMLLHDIAKPEMFCLDENGTGHFKGHPEVGAAMARDILKRLCFDGKTVDAVYDLIAYHSVKIRNETEAKRLVSQLGIRKFQLLMKVKIADNSAKEEFVLAENDDIRRMAEFAEKLEKSPDSCFELSQLKVNGCDIKELGFSGRQIGECLRGLLDDVMEGKIPNERDVLLNTAREMMI